MASAIDLMEQAEYPHIAKYGPRSGFMNATEGVYRWKLVGRCGGCILLQDSESIVVDAQIPVAPTPVSAENASL